MQNTHIKPPQKNEGRNTKRIVCAGARACVYMREYAFYVLIFCWFIQTHTMKMVRIVSGPLLVTLAVAATRSASIICRVPSGYFSSAGHWAYCHISWLVSLARYSRSSQVYKKRFSLYSWSSTFLSLYQY